MAEIELENDASTGIQGLDEVLGGGFRRGAVHVVEGEAGTGKTTLALEFARAGIDAGERVLYFSFSETEHELRSIVESHGWSEKGLDFRYLSVSNDVASGSPQTMLEPGELYLPQATETIRKAIEEVKPHRLAIDSLSDLRLVSQDLWLFRSQLVQLRETLAADRRTTLLLDSMTEYSQHLRTLASGIIHLEQGMGEFGPIRRRLKVLKMRARKHATGPHDFQIVTGGLEVYPRLEAAAIDGEVREDLVGSGIVELDALVGGGLDRGSSVLLLGPAGVGKSLLATQYAAAAAERGERASAYLFDERRHTFLKRARGVGIDLDGPLNEGAFRLRRIDPGEMRPGAFATLLREDVESHDVRLVVIDSLSGYLHAMPDARHLQLHLHDLLTFLSRNGVLTLLVLGEHGPLAGIPQRSLDLSYLADTVLLFRYFEHAGEVHRALSVYKKRSGEHERLIREIQIGPGGVEVGEPLRRFRGVLGGVPEYVGEQLPDRDS